MVSMASNASKPLKSWSASSSSSLSANNTVSLGACGKRRHSYADDTRRFKHKHHIISHKKVPLNPFRANQRSHMTKNGQSRKSCETAQGQRSLAERIKDIVLSSDDIVEDTSQNGRWHKPLKDHTKDGLHCHDVDQDFLSDDIFSSQSSNITDSEKIYQKQLRSAAIMAKSHNVPNHSNFSKSYSPSSTSRGAIGTSKGKRMAFRYPSKDMRARTYGSEFHRKTQRRKGVTDEDFESDENLAKCKTNACDKTSKNISQCFVDGKDTGGASLVKCDYPSSTTDICARPVNERDSKLSHPVNQMLATGLDNVANSNASKQPHSIIELRQCKIGESLAFGLVQVNLSSNGNGYPEGHGLVTIRMTPDEQGRFGFNVKGGADQGMPIIVSRVAPNTPADLAIPRLNEGDQVLYINGRDVSQHTHEQVVMFIRASRETHSGALDLLVRPNVYVSDDQAEEPDFVYLPDSHQIATNAGANALEASLVLLQESLESGAALAQFEQLYRKKPGMTMNAARLEANIVKNRYRDISPYDQTRVILKSGSEYINANYVNMEIPGSGIVNRYIAAQGPLPNTCTDFWQMVWEQRSSLVVMLTTKVERGRVKCHQYWPALYETVDYGELQITCVKEEETTSFAFREFNLTDVATSEERHISHMQYIAWPDHGVPDDPGDFLEFVVKVRQRRVGMVEPCIVHCSAGIGRTGVLITMETAMCLIEANQPVYPLSIVRQMRDQRAMLIQTASQYKFVCEAILKVFNDQIVKPLEDYQR